MQVWQLEEPFCSLRLLACVNFTLDSEYLFCWCKQKKWFLWTMAAAEAAENYGDEWGLTWYFPWGIYKWIPTWTHSQNSLVVAEVLSLKLSSHLTSLKWYQRPPKQHKNSHKPCDQRGIMFWVYWNINKNWERNMIRIFQERGSHCRANTSIRRNKINPKEQDCKKCNQGSE